MKKINLHIMAILLILFTASMSMAKDFIIISISQDFPMTNNQTELKKNFYINIGNKSGVTTGTKLDVFRRKLLSDPYKTKRNYSYKIPMGQIEVIHSEDNSAIAKLVSLEKNQPYTQLDIENLMIGDGVEISVTQ